MKVDFKEIGRNIGGFASKYSPEILTGIGIVGMVTTTVMAVKATPKALELIRCAEEDNHGDLTVRQTVQVAWRCYVPTVVTGVMSASCIIGASSVNAKRNAALTAAYTLSEGALRSYREKVIETLGEDRDREVRDRVAKDKVDNNPPSRNEIFVTSKGNTLCYDAAFGRYFKSDVDTIKRIQNELNRQMLSEMYISLNDFYYELGLKKTNDGDSLGWNIEDGLLDIHFSALITEDNEPCVVIDYHVAPKHKFDKA